MNELKQPPKKKKRMVDKKLGRPLLNRENIAPFLSEKAFGSKRAIADAIGRHESLVCRWKHHIPVKYADDLVKILKARGLPPVVRES